MYHELERKRERERERAEWIRNIVVSEIEVQMALGLVSTERVMRRVNQREPIKTSHCNNTEDMLLQWDVLVGSRWWRDAWRVQWERALTDQLTYFATGIDAGLLGRLAYTPGWIPSRDHARRNGIDSQSAVRQRCSQTMALSASLSADGMVSPRGSYIGAHNIRPLCNKWLSNLYCRFQRQNLFLSIWRMRIFNWYDAYAYLSIMIEVWVPHLCSSSFVLGLWHGKHREIDDSIDLSIWKEEENRRSVNTQQVRSGQPLHNSHSLLHKTQKEFKPRTGERARDTRRDISKSKKISHSERDIANYYYIYFLINFWCD